MTKNVHIGKLDTIANKYNNTYHRAIEMKPVDVKPSTYIDSSKWFMLKILNFKLVILLEYQNIKIFLQKTMFQIGRKKFVIREFKNTVQWTYVISDLKGQ